MTVALAARAGITVVSLPLVNEWTQVGRRCSCEGSARTLASCRFRHLAGGQL